MDANKQKLAVRSVMAAGIGVGMALCFPPFGLPLLPLALCGLLWLLQGATVREGLYIGLACGMAFFALALRWLATMFGPAAITLWALSALFPMLACGLFVWLQKRWPRVPGGVLFGLAWTATEYFRSERMVPQFSWMGLGYSVASAPWLVWPASLIGSYGLTFLICLCGYALFAAAKAMGTEPRTKEIPWRVGAACGLYAAFVLLSFVPRSVPQPQNRLAVRLVQGRSEEDDDLFRLSRTQNGFRPDITLWPEDSYINDPHQTPHLWEKLSALPPEIHGYFLFGARDQRDPKDDAVFQKAAYLLDPSGSLIGKHFKNHIVPFFKEGIAGTEAHALATPLGKLGVGICFDMDYPDVARREVAEGAEVLLVPSDNPLEWGPLQHIQHKQLFQMRAVECDRWLATTDTGGNTYVVAPTGQIVQSVQTTDPTSLNAIVGKQGGQTLFVRFGWRFGQLCLAVLLLLCFGTGIKRKARR